MWCTGGPRRKKANPARFVCLVLGVVGLVIACSSLASANPITFYSVGAFALVNDNADGTVMPVPDGFTLTGGNNGSGLSGTTDLVAIAPVPMVLQYRYSYFSLDTNICDGTGDPCDVPGALVGGNFSPFIGLQPTVTSSGAVTFSGTVMFALKTGESFGFRVATLDNGGEPGILTLSSPVPEPGYIVPVFASLCAAAVVGLVRRRQRGKRLLLCSFGSVGVVAGLLGVTASAQAQSYYGASRVTGQLTRTAITNAARLASAPAFTSQRFFSLSTAPVGPEFNPKFKRPPHPALSRRFSATLAPLSIPMQTLGVTSASNIPGFMGLTHRDQRLANGGNQFSIEPPNSSIAVANGYILEGVNNAIQVYNLAGAPLLATTISTNQLFSLPPAINRSNGINGVYPTDMRVFYDQGLNRWFVLQRAQDNNAAGDPLDSSHLYLAVSRMGDPTGDYSIYTMNTTRLGRPGCPCLSDFPQIGADKYGVYISSNQYNTSSQMFYNVSILAISKADLAADAASPTTYEIVVPNKTGFEFTVRPAITPPGASYYLASGGVEFFLSTQSTFASDSRVAVWALMNTASLNVAQTNLTLIEIIVPAVSYQYPDVARQKPGPLPYGSTLIPPGLLAFIDGGLDSRSQSLVYAGGRLYATMCSQVTDDNGRAQVGGAYAVFSPTWRNGVLTAPLLRSGYLALKNNSILRPSVAVNAQGQGAIVFTVVGPDYYPSVGFVRISTFSTAATVEIVAPGTGPEDGFTGYPDGGGVGVARWGDLSDAVVDADGSVWMTSEYIPNAPRTELANWGTYIARLMP